MRAGPALYQLAAHRAIHQAAWDAAKVAYQRAQAMADGGVAGQARTAVSEFLEVAAMRIMAHAEAEEEALYPAWRRQQPAWAKELTALSRQHRRLRRLAEAIRTALATEGVRGALPNMAAFLELGAQHAAREEALLAMLGETAAGGGFGA